MEDVTLVQCDPRLGCAAVYALDMRGSTVQQRTDMEAVLGDGIACPGCGRAASVREIETITP